MGGLVTSAVARDAIIVLGVLAAFILALVAAVVLTAIYNFNRIVDRALVSSDQMTIPYLIRLLTGAPDEPMPEPPHAVASPQRHGEAIPALNDASHESDALVALHHVAPPSWRGEVVREDRVGPLMTRQPSSLTIWAPDETWPRAGSLLAMCRSVLPERSLILTDTMPRLDIVPADVRIAVVGRGVMDIPVAGTASYSCAELRSDRIFQLLLAGRAWQYPELAPLLRCHALTRTVRGQHFMRRENSALSTLFTGGPEAPIHDELTRGLEELAKAAEDLEQAISRGFAGLDKRVGPYEWERTARQCLPLAAARSPEALAMVERWLASNSDWRTRSESVQESLRWTAANTLYWLADDPWLSSRWTADLVITGLSR